MIYDYENYNILPKEYLNAKTSLEDLEKFLEEGIKKTEDKPTKRSLLIRKEEVSIILKNYFTDSLSSGLSNLGVASIKCKNTY